MGGNILSERFRADSTFAALYDTALADLTEAIFTFGDAAARLQELVELLTADASYLVTAEDLQSDAETITAVLEGRAGRPGSGERRVTRRRGSRRRQRSARGRAGRSRG